MASEETLLSTYLEPKHLVAYLLFLLVGLLLTYRQKKSKERSQENKDEEKGKKAKPKKVPKFKEKENVINGSRSRKSDAVVETDETKMGISHSACVKKRSSSAHAHTTSKPITVSAPPSTNNFQTNLNKAETISSKSAGTLGFLSDEISPNRSVARQSSLRVLHKSIIGNGSNEANETSSVRSEEEIKINGIDSSSRDKIGNEKIINEKIINEKIVNEKIIDNIQINELETEIFSDKSKNLGGNEVNRTDSISETINFVVKKETHSTSSEKNIDFHQNNVSYATKLDIDHSAKKQLDTNDSVKTDLVIGQKCLVTSNVTQDVGKGTELLEEIKPLKTPPETKTSRTYHIIARPERPAFLDRIKTEKVIDKSDEREELVTSSECESLVEQNDAIVGDTENDVFDKENGIIKSDEDTVISCGIISSDVQVISPFTISDDSPEVSSPTVLPTSTIDPVDCTPISKERTFSTSITFKTQPNRSLSNSKKKDFFEDKIFQDYNNILLEGIIQDTFAELKTVLLKQDLTCSFLPEQENKVEDEQSSSSPGGSFSTDIPTKSEKDFLCDFSLVADSMSYNILDNVLKESELIAKKTTKEEDSIEFHVVIENSDQVDNKIHESSSDECDSGTSNNFYNSSISEETLDSSLNESKHEEEDMGNANGTNNDKETIQKVIEESVEKLKETPRVVENKENVVLRRSHSRRRRGNRNHLSSPVDEKVSYTGTDRPLSGFAEQLAELLADDDFDADFEFDSDSELPDALEKIKETIDKPDICQEIGKIQRKCSRVELNEYGSKKFKSKVKSKLHDKKDKKLKSDRPLSLYEQDLLSDLMSNDEEFDDSDEVVKEETESVESSVQFLEDLLPIVSRHIESESSTSSISTDFEGLDDTPKYNGTEPRLSLSSVSGKVPVLGKAAVIDLGSGILKAGMCGEMKPSCYCPSVIGVPRRLSQDVSKMKKGYYVGDEAWTMAGMLSIDYPVKQNVTNWSDVTSVIEHLLDIELKVDNNNHPVLLTEMSLASSKQREKLTEVMFETFNVPAFYLANQAALALYSMGMTTGLCLNSGFNCTQSVPVYEGCTLPYATYQLDIGGLHVTDQLGRILLGTQGVVFNTSSEKLVLNTMKQSLCYVAQDFASETDLYKTSTSNLRTYTLPDGQELELGTERFQAPEILFDPGILGLNKPNCAELIQQSTERVERSLQPLMKDNVLICGGTTKFSGYGPRLEKELSHLSRNGETFNVKYVDNPLLATWVGGSVLSSIASFRDQWITIDQYAETGSKIVHKVCF